MPKTLTVAAAVLCVLACGARGDDWPQFRGPRQDGISGEKGLLRSWPEGGPKVLWTVPLGLGYGGPAVRDGTCDGTSCSSPVRPRRSLDQRSRSRMR